MATEWNFLDPLGRPDQHHSASSPPPPTPPPPLPTSPPPPPSRVLNCFVCDVRTEDESKFVNVFHSTYALQEELKQRLEGVLAVTLEERQPTGPNMCTGCKNKLVTIETLAVELRQEFQNTTYRHGGVSAYPNICGDEFMVKQEQKSSEGYPQGAIDQRNTHPLQFHFGAKQHRTEPKVDSVKSDFDSCIGDQDSRRNTENLSPVPKSGSKKERTLSVEISTQTEKEEEKLLNSENEELSAEAKLTEENEAPFEQAEVAEPSPVKASTSRKRKSAVPQRIFTEESSPPPEDFGLDSDDSVNLDSEQDDKPYEPVVRKKRRRIRRVIPLPDDSSNEAIDIGQLPDVETDFPVVKKRKRGRPKGSKNKVRSVHTNNSLIPKAKQNKIQKEKLQQGGKCEICEKTFENNYKLNRHKLSHSEERPYKCPQCDNTFKAKYHLERHMQIHSGVRPHVCDVCGVTFREKHQLSEHKLSHTGEYLYTCEQCGQGFQKASSLKQHMYDHTGSWPFKCTVCNAGFVREAELKEHSTMHTGEKPHKCTQCGDTFRLANTLKVHMRRHTGIKPYACKLCSATFAAANTLKEHLRTHSGERKFLCHTCGSAFVHQSGLVQHTKTHLAVEDRKHVCQYCQRRFNELSLLKRHQRIHTGERPYMCSKCGKAFRRPGELSMHYRYHSNDRRYTCSTCNKSFFTKSHLKRHQATHNSTVFSPGSASVYQSKPPTMVSNQPGHHLQNQQSLSSSQIDPSLSSDIHHCMICSKQFHHIELLTKHIAKVHTQNVGLDEQLTSVASIEDYTNPYNAEDLGLPYMPMQPMHILPQ